MFIIFMEVNRQRNVWRISTRSITTLFSETLNPQLSLQGDGGLLESKFFV